MSGSEDTQSTSTGNRAASKLYRRPPGAAWLLALAGNPATAGPDRLGRPEQVRHTTPTVHPEGQPVGHAGGPDVNAPKVNAPDQPLPSVLRSASIQRTARASAFGRPPEPRGQELAHGQPQAGVRPRHRSHRQPEHQGGCQRAGFRCAWFDPRVSRRDSRFSTSTSTATPSHSRAPRLLTRQKPMWRPRRRRRGRT